jgi:hypothetical protein
MLRFLIGLLLIPVAVSVTWAAAALLADVRPAALSGLPAGAWALLGGIAGWNLVYLTLPRPTRTYVLAHELTHALWAALLGARVHSIRVRGETGSVEISGHHFLIALAPYFFPLYTVLVIGLYYALGVFVPVERYDLVWLGLVGFTWGFHATFTIAMLRRRQSDVQAYGHLFSYAVIYLLNVVGITVWVIMVSSATLEQWVGLLGREAAWWRDLAINAWPIR